MRTDVVILGAGVVGVAAALHLQKRGRSVVLVDRVEPGRATSYGNAGIIQREAILPYAFPRSLLTIMKYALNNQRDACYHFSSLLTTGPWLFKYWQASSPRRVAQTATANLPMYNACGPEHAALAAEAGVSALLRPDGWMQVYRTDEGLREAIAEGEKLGEFGVKYDLLDSRALAEREPHLSGGLIGGLHWREPCSVGSPLALTQGYFALFEKRGGQFLQGDAKTLRQEREGWSVEAGGGRLTAGNCVIALGPWSNDITEALGYRLPLGIKRGYHMHYTARGNAVLNHPIQDSEGGYLLAPMNQGVRLTTGAEFALRDAPPTPVQLARVEPWARNLFPIDARVEPEPWMGRRPCFPDMMPLIGPAPRHKGLWFNFGHAHHGLTLSAVGGRLLAEMMTGEKPFTDPAPYGAGRF